MAVVTAFDVQSIEIPLSRPFETSRDKLARQVTRIVQVRLHCDDGTAGIGEAVAVQYVTGETHEQALVDCRIGAEALLGFDVLSSERAHDRLFDAIPNSPSARAGVEMAAFNCFSHATGTPLWRHFGGAMQSVETDITLSLGEDASERAREAVALGFRVLKMKLGSSGPAKEAGRVAEVASAAPTASIRLDANQAFTPDEALELAEILARTDIRVELLEQPVDKHDLLGLAHVARNSPIPVYADEAVLTEADARRVIFECGVAGVNVKLMKSGIEGAIRIGEAARELGAEAMLGCMLESRRGIAAALAVACGTGLFAKIDLDSHMLLAEEGPNTFFRQEGPVLTPL